MNYEDTWHAKMNKKALKHYVGLLEEARKELERINQFIDDNGENDPEDVTFADVGDIAEVVGQLKTLRRFINNEDEDED